MLIDRIIDARVPGRASACDIHLEQGRVARVTEPEASLLEGAALAARGRVVLPAFVDAHVHLDKAFLLRAAEHERPLAPRLDSAIAAVAALRGTISIDAIHAGAERALETLVRNGTTAARAHVEIEPTVRLSLVHMHLALRDAFADRIHLQLVAFPQRGLELPGMVELFSSAMSEGLDVVGGCPYVDADPARHLDIVFALAERLGLPIDLHLDFSDDPARSLLPLVVERTLSHGAQGRVTIGHVTTLAAMRPDDRSAALDVLASAGIALVVLPATDLYLAGHGDRETRSLAPIHQARSAGVRVAIANNNLNNPFAPFGNGSLVQAAWLAGIVGRAATPDARSTLLGAITHEPASILGLRDHGPCAGADAHLALLDVRAVDEVVLQAPPVLAALRDGRVVYRAEV